VLMEHKDELVKLAQHLLKYEVAEKEDLERILGRRKESDITDSYDQNQLSLVYNN